MIRTKTLYIIDEEKPGSEKEEKVFESLTQIKVYLDNRLGSYVDQMANNELFTSKERIVIFDYLKDNKKELEDIFKLMDNLELKIKIGSRLSD